MLQRYLCISARVQPLNASKGEDLILSRRNQEWIEHLCFSFKKTV